MARQSMRYELKPAGYDDTAAFYVYNDHYKASQGTDSGATTSNANRRNAEAWPSVPTSTRFPCKAMAQAHRRCTPATTIFIQTPSPRSPPFQLLWPLATARPMTRSIELAHGTTVQRSKILIHSRLAYPAAPVGSFATGGMDDRFDFQWATGKLIDTQGMSYISGSYHAFGSNGSTFNDNINNMAANTYVFNGVTSYTKQQVLDSIWGVSDHIPVVADYQIPAKMSVAVGTVPLRMIVGSSTNVGVTVTNSAPSLSRTVLTNSSTASRARASSLAQPPGLPPPRFPAIFTTSRSRRVRPRATKPAPLAPPRPANRPPVQASRNPSPSTCSIIRTAPLLTAPIKIRSQSILASSRRRSARRCKSSASLIW